MKFVEVFVALTLSFVPVLATSQPAMSSCEAAASGADPFAASKNGAAPDVPVQRYGIPYWQAKVEGDGPPLAEDANGWTDDPAVAPRIQASWIPVMNPDLKASSGSFRYLAHVSWMTTAQEFNRTLNYLGTASPVSCSLITPDHVKTFVSPIGFILRAKPRDLGATANHDFGSGNDRYLEAKKTRKTDGLIKWRGIDTPGRLQRLSTGEFPDNWNEVLLVNVKPGDVQAAAVLILTDKNGNLNKNLTPEIMNMIERMAKKYDLPIVKIADPDAI